MHVGIMIEGQEGLTWDRWSRLIEAAEGLGYESLCRSDHLTGLNGQSRRPSLDTWTSLTVVAERTKRIRFGPMVSPLTFYHPAILDEDGGGARHAVGRPPRPRHRRGLERARARDVRRPHAAAQGAAWTGSRRRPAISAPSAPGSR